ncbi:MAG: type I DNA topoisomerase [Bacteroidaceae bacterium]|nr:type I DNA topoisomerase [Bacteroidaceae bacterium]
MPQNLVIVESPAKAKTIEKFLGEGYKVMSSYGHIRDLKKKSFSINLDTFQPEYEVPADKQHIVTQLRQSAKKAEMVWLASDEDREGEAISWHLEEVLRLKPEKTRRIVFHEITKTAIQEAIENPRNVDMALVNAQQARRVLDRIVGFKLSPVLWRKVKPGLSAGRVQSVAVRLIVEREREVHAFKSESYYRVVALFTLPSGSEVRAELNRRFNSRAEAEEFLKDAGKATFTIEDIQTKPLRRSPAPPFTTSTLQQEAAHKLGFAVAQTMLVAQHLYENGIITYMRTDSVNLSQLALGTSKKVISEMMGDEYVKTRQYHTSSKGAQEAHEAIRPTYMDRLELPDNMPTERRLYDLIWKRTIASQMADAEMEKTVATIGISGRDEKFIATGEVVKFEGFLKVYRETATDDENESESTAGSNILPPMSAGEKLSFKSITAAQRFTQAPQRFNEASLVKKLEELGIGRPSTYAPIISTIQQREYVIKGEKPGEEHQCLLLSIGGDGSKSEEMRTVVSNAERGRLLPTDTGIVVNDFLMQYFPEIMDFNFTAEVEKEFDSIANGKEQWTEMIQNFWGDLEPLVDETIHTKTELRVGERILGNDPKTGKVISVKIGRFGPVVQMGVADEIEKPRFAQLQKGQSMESLTLEDALELFRLPRTLGQFEDDDVIIGTGRYGNYILHKKKFVSIPGSADPLTITLEDAIGLIQKKRNAEHEKHLRTFEQDPKLEILNGRFGPYIVYDGENYRIPKNLHDKVAEITYKECMQLIKNHEEKSKTPRRYRKK